MKAGKAHKIKPFGFEALDMVRIEAGLVFGGHDFCSNTDPLEAGIGFSIPTKKEEDYIGKAAIERRRATPARKLVGLEVTGNEKPSHGDPLFVGRAEIGVITSAMRSPCSRDDRAGACRRGAFRDRHGDRRRQARRQAEAASGYGRAVSVL